MRSLEHRLLAYVQDLEDGGHPKGTERKRKGERERQREGGTALSTRADAFFRARKEKIDRALLLVCTSYPPSYRVVVVVVAVGEGRRREAHRRE